MPQKLATSLVFIKWPRNAQMKRLANRKIMIFKLVVATYITSKVAFFIQPTSHTLTTYNTTSGTPP